MEEKTRSLKKTARLAGILYLALAITAAYSLMYVPSKLIVSGDSVTTSKNILAGEFLFRTGIASQLISQSLFVFLVLVLYHLFKTVNTRQAKLMVALVLVSVPVVFLLETCNITALLLLKGELLPSLAPQQSQEMALLFLKTHDYGINIVQIFWGLWLIPFGQLVYASGFIPRLLGVLLIVAGVGYVILSGTILLFPNYTTRVSSVTSIFASIGELSILAWLLIIGVKIRATN